MMSCMNGAKRSNECILDFTTLVSLSGNKTEQNKAKNYYRHYERIQMNEEKKPVKEENGQENGQERTVRKFKNYAQTYEIVNEISYGRESGRVVLREFDTMCCDGSAIVVGFPRSAKGDMLASGTAQFIVQQLELPLVGDIRSDHFPSVAMMKQSTPHNSIRIYGNKRMVVIVSDLDIKDPAMEHAIVRAIYEFARRHRCSMIVTVDAVAMDTRTVRLVTGEIDEDSFALGKDTKPAPDTPVPKSREELLTLLSAVNSNKKNGPAASTGEELLFVTNREEMANRLEEMGHRAVVNHMNVVGFVGGIMAEMSFSRTTVISLFALLKPQQIIATNATITLVHAIDKLLGRELLIDTTQLEKAGRELQDKVQTVLKDIQEKERGGAMSHMYT